jgi:hypothetical protein
LAYVGRLLYDSAVWNLVEKTMSKEIKPGSTVEVKVVKAPRTQPARYTLGRIFLRDPAVRKSRSSDAKPVREHRRGGRMWRARPRGTVLQIPAVGDTCTVRASVELLRDLANVTKFVSVKARS